MEIVARDLVHFSSVATCRVRLIMTRRTVNSTLDYTLRTLYRSYFES
jgi:hypothetical protein